VERDVKNYLESKSYYQLRTTPAAKRLAAKENIDILTLGGKNAPDASLWRWSKEPSLKSPNR